MRELRERATRDDASAALARRRSRDGSSIELGNRQALALLRRRSAPSAGARARADLEREADREAATGSARDPAALAGVRIHTGDDASRAAAAHGARAYTVGDDVYFGRGEYRPETTDGRELIAHELAHVQQQRRAGSQWVQCKKYPLDPAKPKGDEVDVATDEELKKARKIYDYIVTTYQVTFDSAGAASIYSEVYREKVKESELNKLFFHETQVVAWTLPELEALRDALDELRLLYILPSDKDTVRAGPRTVGRVDRPATDPRGLMGEVKDPGRITLFDKMHDSTEPMLDLIAHELGHVFFDSLTAQFERLGFWSWFPPTAKPDEPRADPAAYQRLLIMSMTVNPPKGMSWPDTEPPVSDYGYKSPQEDAAEAVKYYVVHVRRANDGTMEKMFPKRWQLVDAAWTAAWKRRKTQESLRAGPSATVPGP